MKKSGYKAPNSMPFRMGSLIHGRVYGGPYTRKPLNMAGVKMAAEIDLPYEVSVPTEDWSVPTEKALLTGLHKALLLLAGGATVYVGCKGGIGRTGLFMACLAKVRWEYLNRRGIVSPDPLLYVREHYYAHAVETPAQVALLRRLDVGALVDWYEVLQAGFLGNTGVTKSVQTSAQDVVAEELQQGLDDLIAVPSKYPKILLPENPLLVRFTGGSWHVEEAPAPPKVSLWERLLGWFR